MTASESDVDEKISGTLDMNAVKAALWYLSQKYEVLRAAFVFPEGTGRPLQVILRDREPELIDVRVSNWSQVEELKRQDVLRGFDLARDTLLRITIVRFSDEQAIMLWSSHHIIMDGWCASILFRDFMDCYNSQKRSADKKALEKRLCAERDNVLPFSEYVAWLEKQSRNRANQYWDNLLDGYSEVAEIPSIASQKEAFQFCVEDFEISEKLSKTVERMAVNYHVTVSTVLESVWGILLQKYNRVDDNAI